jgi:putative protease
LENNFELLAPAGDMEKLKTAIHFGADAVYFAGKKFGLRAFASNFENIAEPVEYAHKFGKKAYVTVNIYPRNNDLDELEKYIKEIAVAGADGVIVSDIGIMDTIQRVAPNLELHISTQANTTNINSALAYVNHFNAKRVVLARELSLDEVSLITKNLAEKNVEVEVFVHGAMCISYSGRCLLSNYLTGRDSNKGECVQACRYSYYLSERADAPENSKFAEERKDNYYQVLEDNRGTYILNSKDLCLVHYLKELMNAGVKSFKIEGRMKSPYYLATVVNTYRRAIDAIIKNQEDKRLNSADYVTELEKSSHRKYTTGFMVDDGEIRQNYETNHQTQTANFLGIVKGKRVRRDDGRVELLIEMRNRFKVGDIIEILSPTVAFNQRFVIEEMQDNNGESVTDAKKVQQKLYVLLAPTHSDASMLAESSLQAVLEGDIVRSV